MHLQRRVFFLWLQWATPIRAFNPGLRHNREHVSLNFLEFYIQQLLGMTYPLQDQIGLGMHTIPSRFSS